MRKVIPVLAIMISVFAMSFAQLANSAWPMFGQNNQHSFRSAYNGPSTPKLLWVYDMVLGAYPSPVIATDGTIYSGSMNFKFFALQPDGTKKWEYTSTQRVQGSAAVAKDGTVYQGVDDGNLNAYNPDGTVKWIFKSGTTINGTINSKPAIANDGTIYVGSNDKNVYAINPDGTRKWAFLTGGLVNSGPAIATDGTVYIGSYDKNLYALNPDGTKKWSFTTGDMVQASPSIALDGTIYIGSNDSKLYALKPDGTQKWAYTTGGAIAGSPGIAADGTIYFGSDDNKVYALNPDGTLKWSYATKDGVHSSPAIGADGVIYIPSTDANIYALNPDGSKKWSYQVGFSIQSSPSISATGVLYVGCQDGKFYAIGNGGTTAKPTLILTSPNGGEQWQQGTPHPITWTSTGNVGNVIIELFKGGVFDKAITATAQNTGSFDWTVPQTQTAGTDYKIKITAAADTTITATSAADFEVTAGNTVKPTITITSPNGGEKWVQGSINKITWTSSTTLGNLQIDLYKGGVFSYTILTPVADTGICSWDVPAYKTPVGTDYRVKIFSIADPTITATSAADFEVTAGNTVTPTITVTSPNGGEQWLQGSLHNITWTSTGNPGNVKIELFKAGALNSVIIADVANNGSYSWTVPATQIAGTDYRVKISEVADATITGQSTADFEVSTGGTAKPTITVTSPNGGEQWLKGSVHPITWTSTGNPGNVKIELFKAGVLNIVITADIANNGTYNWTVPATQAVGTDYRVKISEVADATITGQSAADFAVAGGPTTIKAQWPMYRYNIQHTGRSPYNGPANPTQQWSFTTGDSIHSSPAIAADGTIYVGSWDKNLYAFNPDGTKKWSFATTGQIWSSPGIGDDGTIYVGSDDNFFYAINPDGTKKWSYDTGKRVSASPVFAADGTIYVGSNYGTMFAFNPDGTLKWKFSATNFIHSTPAIGADGTIYFGCYDNTFYAVTAAGQLKWKFSASNYFSSSPAIATDGTIYVGCHNGQVYALNPDGTKKWEFLTGSEIYSGPAIASNGTIYIGSYDNNLYAINPDGTKKWSFTAGNTIYTSPCIDASGVIYVGSKDRKVYAINPDGTQKWSFTTGGNVYSSVSIGANGVLYFGSYDSKLYALGTGGVVQPGITITSPNGGEQWARGSSQNVTWTSTGITGNVKIDLFKGGVYVNTISWATPNSGLFNWTVAMVNAPGTDYKVKITSLANTAITSQSAADFAITSTTTTPTITIISPNGGEQWQQGTTRAITWRSSNLTGTVKIDLYKTGTLDSVISATVANTGSYSWAIPGTQAIGTDYRVRISSVTTTSTVASSQSAGNFAITATAPVASIAVTTPNGGEQWLQGSAQNITWTSNSITGNVKIDLYKAGTISSTIVASVANTGTYSWSIPPTQTAGTDYRVRITSVANTRVFDDSNADFSITATVKTPGVPVQVSPANNAVNVKLPVTIAWLPVSGAVRYEYELYSAASATVPVETNVVTTTSAVIQLALTDGTKYSWRVRATNASDISSAYSSLWSFTTTISVAPLNAPTLITPADGAIDVPLSTLFTWSPVTNAIAYDIDISTNADFSKKATLSTTKTSITASLANVTVYYWRVRAKQGNNVSPWSAVSTFTTIAFIATSGLDAAISNSKVGSQLMGVGVINDTGDFQTVQLDMPINRQSEFYVAIKNTGNQPDSFLISSTSTIGSKWKVNIFDISGINRTVKVFNSGWTSYTVKPGESVQIMLRFAAVSGQVIDATNPPTQSIIIKAQSLKDLYSGSTTPSSDTVVATAVLVKRFGL